MNRPLCSLALVALLSAGCGVNPNRPDFTFLESPPLASGTSQPYLVHAPDGTPWIAYADYNAAQPRVAKWTGSRWEELGKAQTSRSPAVFGVQLDFSPSGQPFVGHRTYDSEAVSIRTWEGNEWRDVPTLSTNDLNDMADWNLRIDPAGQPVIATANFETVEVRRLTGGEWLELGPNMANNIPNPNGATITLNKPSLELDPRGNPVVAHLEGTSTLTQLWVQRWTGTEWQRLGDALFLENGFIQVTEPELELAPDGRPHVAWVSNDMSMPLTRTSVIVSRWTGQAWERMGGPIAAPDGVTPIQAPLLKFDDQGRAVLSFLQGTQGDVRIHLRRWNGTSWDTLGEPLTGLEKDTLFSHTLSIGPDGAPLVAWPQRLGESVISPGRYVLYVARYNEGR
jgi:hypothetical protein